MVRDLFEGWHLIILLVVVLLLFGSRRLPEGARALGRSLRIFKSEVKGLTDDDAEPAPPQQLAASPPAPPAVPPAPAAPVEAPPMSGAPSSP
ncbi:MAG TPA: Sec-independent protein translocase subunit TatA [Mycobacteriales bacterium]|nr:Sec-independent protein translocase subunit TatA [Mycobacteriales bacterium]